MLYNLFENRDFVSVFAVALLAEGVDRNNEVGSSLPEVSRSPSSRRAWIEIESGRCRQQRKHVALLAEGVDRNYNDGRYFLLRYNVALLAEGVDRNSIGATKDGVLVGSPSSRRAWIEIPWRCP